MPPQSIFLLALPEALLRAEVFSVCMLWLITYRAVAAGLLLLVIEEEAPQQTKCCSIGLLKHDMVA